MAIERIEQILSLLWERSRFASYFYQMVAFLPHEGIPTLALVLRSGSLILYYNQKFMESLTVEETIGLLVHEMLHLVLSHNHRAMPGQNPYLQNLAQDMVVNSFLTSHSTRFFSRTDDYSREGVSLTLPVGLPLIPKKFYEDTGIHDPSWEDLYRWLTGFTLEKRKTMQLSSSEKSGIDVGEGLVADQLNNSVFKETATLSSLEETMRSLSFEGMNGMVFLDSDDSVLPSGTHLAYEFEPALAQSKRDKVFSVAGKDPDCQRERFYQEITAIISGTRKVAIPRWQQLLKSVVDFTAQTNEWTYTYGRFNRRYSSSGIYAPGRVWKEQMMITVAIDVSGSMVTNPRDIESAFGAIEELLVKYRINMVCLDEELFVPELREYRFVHSRSAVRPYFYKKGDWRYLKTGFGGTTLFAPLFNRYMKGHHETLVVITDGYIYDLDVLHRYLPTVWLLPEGRSEPFHPPFGRSIVMS